MAGPVGLDRDHVLEVAAQLANEVGLEQVTLAELASRLEIRSQSLYAHVDGIAGLRRDLGLFGLDLLAEDLRDAAIAKSGRSAIYAIANAYRRFEATQPGLYTATVRDPRNDDEVQAAMTRATEPLLVVLATYGMSAQQSMHWYRIFWSSIHGFVSLQRSGLLTLPANPDDTFDQMIEMFANELETMEPTKPDRPN